MSGNPSNSVEIEQPIQLNLLAINDSAVRDTPKAQPAESFPRKDRREPLLKIRPQRGWAALNLGDVWHFHELLVALALRDVKLRYKQTALGVIWVVLQPLLAAGIFSFVFGTVAGLKSGQATPYFVFSYAGLLGWNLFSNTLTRCSTCLLGNSQLISKVFFPRLVLPLSTVPSSLIDFGVALAMFVVLLWMHHIVPHGRVLLFPAWLLLLMVLSSGIGLWVAALSVTYRDVQHVLPVFLQLLLYASPVAYPISRIPARLMVAFHLNPMVSIIGGIRWSLLRDVDQPHWGFVAYAAVLSTSLLVSGAFAFKRMERKFADVI